MAGGTRIVWIPFLLSCLFQASDNRYVSHEVFVAKGPRLIGGQDVADIISKLPITLPDGINPDNVNITTITIKTCTGMKEQLAVLSSTLRQTTLRNNQLDNEAFDLRRVVRKLNLQLATCSSMASAVTGSYQTQLHTMNQLLGRFGSDTFLVLKIIALTREVKTLQNKVRRAANSTETAELRVLQSEEQVKTNELNEKRQQLERSHTNSSLILQIISLQNEIWDVEQVEARKGETSLQPNNRILNLQGQLDGKIRELRGNRDTVSAMLELTSVHSKVTLMQRMINVHTEESRANAANYQRQRRQKVELLKRKILQLNREEDNSELTKDILLLQSEVENLTKLMMDAKKTADAQLKELQAILEGEKKQQANLQKLLEASEYDQAQLIINIISIMKEVRELDDDDRHPTTSTSQGPTLQTLLQAKEREFAKAQDEIKELQQKLRLQGKKCSGLEERYENAKTEFEQKIAELNRTGDSTAALILFVINLHDELKTLRDQISNTEDPDRIRELTRQLEEKQDELNSRTADIERLIPNPKIILTIIELQNEIWDLQTKADNETTRGHVKELQDRVAGLITQIGDKRDNNTKLMLKIMTLQSQLEQLQRQLSDLQKLGTTQVTQLTNDLKTKKDELQKYVNELNEKNQTNSRLILTTTDLHNQLRNLKKEKDDEAQKTSVELTELREELQEKVEEHSRDQTEIKALQTLLQAKEREFAKAQDEIKELQQKLRLQGEKCSGLEERYENAKTEFEQKIAELNRTGDSTAALILFVINLHDELKTLRDQISNTEDPDRIRELTRQLEEKQDELNSRTADIERLIPNPKIILTIIELQNEIWDLQTKADNETTRGHVKELQDRVAGLITQIGDKRDNSTKLMLKIMTLQSQLEQLQRQLSDLQKLGTTQVTQLTNDLKTKKDELQKYVNELNEKNQTNSRLILTTTDLHNQLRNLKKEKDDEAQKTSVELTELREELQEKVEEHSRDQTEIKGLQNKLNQTEAQCSGYENKLKNLQNDLDGKMTELQSASKSVSSLALQISTLSLQLEELKKQLENTESETKIKELQKLIDEKDKELTKKREELKEQSAQPQRILQIIAIQTQIEKMANVAANDTDYIKIDALQDHLNSLINGIQDENNENTKLMFKMLAQQDEIARLEKQRKSQTEAAKQKIKDHENELEDIRSQIKEKTLILNSADTEIAELSAQIKRLQNKIKPLEDEISDLKETSAENEAELQKRLDLTKRQLQDSELIFREVDAKNFNLIMEIADLRSQLKKAQKKASKAAEKNSNDLEQQLQTQQRENRELENTNKVLQNEKTKLEDNVQELQTKLRLQGEKCSGLEERYENAKTEFEQKIAELNRTGDSTAALILSVINLHDELKTLRDQISNTEDPDRIRELQRQLKEKQEELNSKTADIERLIPNPKIVLTIIELQNEIWDLQTKADNETTGDRVEELQNRVDDLISQIGKKGGDNTKLVLKIMTLQSQLEQLQRQLSDLQKLGTTQVTQLTNDLKTKKDELQKYVNELNEKNQTNTRLILTTTDLHNQLRNLKKEKDDEAQKTSVEITKLREELKEKVEEHSRDQTEIKGLQNKLNQTEAQCSGYENKLKDLQNDLGDKLKELQSKSESVSSLALQISTLSLQLEELKRQLENTASETKIKELQKNIDEINDELTKKTEELKARSTQPQRLLQIIAIQTEIEKFVNVAANDTDYNKITELQNQLNGLVDEIQDENNENTKLMFKIMAQQDEIARLEKQEKSQTQAALEKVTDLEDELEDIRSQIKDKTLMLNSSDTRIAELSAQIMGLLKKIKPLEDEISNLKERSAQRSAELQKKLDLTKRQLQDSEVLFREADAKNVNLIMEITDLRAQLKKAQKKASEAAEKQCDELEKQLQAKQRENRRVENTNEALKQEIKELKMSCSDDLNTQCDDLQRQLLQSQEDADRLQQQLLKKNAKLKQLQQDLEDQIRQNNTLQHGCNNLERQLQQARDNADSLQQQLREKDATLNQLQQELEEQTRENNTLWDEYSNLGRQLQQARDNADYLQQQLHEKDATLNQLQQELEEQAQEKNKLQGDYDKLQSELNDVEDKTIHTSQMTFDPNTAHPRIALSEDNTEISTRVLQNVPQTPSRFDTVLAVLGTTGFSSGRHYWEVSVAGKLCYHLGMASESARRTGSLTFGPAKGFWTIVLNKEGQYRAIDRTAVIIPVLIQPLTLGILLDYKKGQISFYDSGARSHMYTFVGQKFTDKIYPFIHFCVEDTESRTPIVLLPPGAVDWIQ